MKTPISYYGGKQTMLKHIRPLIPAHSLYCEPYAGGAVVFFDKEPAKVNVINDLNGELVNFYRTVVTSFEELRSEVYATLHSRSIHNHAAYIYGNPQFFTNVQRAWAVWSLSKQGFSGIIPSSFAYGKKKSLHATKIGNAKFAFDAALKQLLERATLECDSATAVIKRYDTADTWYFVDPPYVGCDMGHYKGMFNEQDLQELLDLLACLQGKFMLTMYPNAAINHYANKHGWRIHEVERNVTACSVRYKRKQVEWMVVNYSV